MILPDPQPLQIGILSKHNAFDRNAFSGTVFYMRRALEAHGTVRVLGGHNPLRSGLVGKLSRRLQAPRPLTLTAADMAGLDVIIAPVAASEVAQFGPALKTPLITITDATPGFLQDFYNKTLTQDYIDQEAYMIARADAVVYSSEFMAQQAQVEFAEARADKLHVVPFGVNLDTLPAQPPAKPPLDRLELLFIGQDWQRKGGAIALDTLDALSRAGVRAHLTTIGASDPAAQAHPDVTVLGYLNKNTPRDMDRFNAALTQAHILLLPTRADCTPMVIAEANAYGCPVVVTETGGIATLMRDGVNGCMLPMTAGGADYASALRRLTDSPAAYAALSQSSFDHCHAHLTWQAWAKGMARVIDGVLMGTPHEAL